MAKWFKIMLIDGALLLAELSILLPIIVYFNLTFLGIGMGFLIALETLIFLVSWMMSLTEMTC